MQVKDLMTSDPSCCTAQDTLQKAAQLMVDCDCGEIPVVDDTGTKRPVGVITDRDIACRTVARGLNPLEMTVGDVMSTPVICVKPDDALEDACYKMEQNQIRRVPVVDETGACVGIVSMADISQNAGRSDAGELLHQVSERSVSASNVA
jgi:CBS domain-containing protein